MMSPIAAIEAAGGFLVRWQGRFAGESLPRWTSPDGALSLDDTTVNYIAVASRGTFCAWRITPFRGPRFYGAEPVVFRLIKPGQRLPQWAIALRLDVDQFLGNVFAEDEAEALRVAVLAGLAVSPQAILAVEIPAVVEIKPEGA